MSAYVGIHTQIARNNRKSVLYLLAFPALILAAVYAFIYFISADDTGFINTSEVNDSFLLAAPWVITVVLIWFLIAFSFHNKMINAATHARPLERKENMRVYNLVENLCISQGMTMPRINIIEDQGLNAFASGLNEKTFTVTLTRGIIEKLNDDELEGVIAHELMHILNRDVRLLVISIIFVGIFSFLVQVLFRNMFYGSMRKNNNKNNKAILIAAALALIAYLLSLVFKFGLSRKREYMADAGAADMTKKPWALASALRKISGNHQVRRINSDDVKEMFIENKPDKSSGFMGALTGLFATHPPIEKRIAVLEGF
ncbi:MAG TPA: M48 family metallopeptidase [Cyclobacteriaceae bacterium]|nr:M48 family metallopeptidase [Cyclobacteriaceae bacterium]